MIEIKKAFENLTSEEFSQLLDAPVWIALAAAYAGDGAVSEDEKAEAIKLAHLRRFTAPKSLREFYELVDTQFAQRFYILDLRLPSALDDKEIYLERQLKRVHDIMLKLDPDVTSSLEESLESFYEHVFSSHKSFFQYFALPILSNRLDKNSGHFRFSDEK
ncbi:MAG: hypothetical protein WBG42_13625 [Cryomorphaceae bacterium]